MFFVFVDHTYGISNVFQFTLFGHAHTGFGRLAHSGPSRCRRYIHQLKSSIDLCVVAHDPAAYTAIPRHVHGMRMLKFSGSPRLI